MKFVILVMMRFFRVWNTRNFLSEKLGLGEVENWE